MTTESFASRDLGKGFSTYFEILPALDDATRDQAFSIRHQVYCEDLGFEAVRADRLETDEYDAQSLHCLLRTSGDDHALVGCSRLVLARPDDPDHPFPFERACAANLDLHTVDSRRLPRHKIAEVSRLAVRKTYRRRRDDNGGPVPLAGADSGDTPHVRFPFIPVGLYLGTMAIAERQGIEHTFTLTELRLADHLAKLGFQATQIGPAIEHHGQRIPSIIDVQGSIRSIRTMIRPMWHVIREAVNQAFDARRP